VKTLHIRWQRLVDEHERTCDRCGATEAAVDEAAGQLTRSLGALGIDGRERVLRQLRRHRLPHRDGRRHDVRGHTVRADRPCRAAGGRAAAGRLPAAAGRARGFLLRARRVGLALPLLLSA